MKTTSDKATPQDEDHHALVVSDEVKLVKEEVVATWGFRGDIYRFSELIYEEGIRAYSIKEKKEDKQWEVITEISYDALVEGMIQIHCLANEERNDAANHSKEVYRVLTLMHGYLIRQPAFGPLETTETTLAKAVLDLRKSIEAPEGN